MNDTGNSISAYRYIMLNGMIYFESGTTTRYISMDGKYIVPNDLIALLLAKCPTSCYEVKQLYGNRVKVNGNEYLISGLEEGAFYFTNMNGTEGRIGYRSTSNEPFLDSLEKLLKHHSATFRVSQGTATKHSYP